MAKLTGKVNFFRPVSPRLSRDGTAPLKEKTQKTISKILKFIEDRPLTIFLFLLAILFVLIATGNFLRKPEEEIKPEPKAIQVETFTIGTAPRVSYQAKIEKAGVVNIVSQTAGIVSKIKVREGDIVLRGQNLLSLSQNYLGDNAASAQRQLAGIQHKHILETFDLSHEAIAKQREIAHKTDENADKLRDIADDSLGETKSLVELNNDILSDLDETISQLEATNTGGVNDDLILQTKQLKSQFLAGNNQAKNALRQAEFNTRSDEPQAKLFDLQKDLTLKQLELQEKSLELSRETSALQFKLAQVNESLFAPASPFEGKVERVHVKVGEAIQPGTPLITLSGSNSAITAVAYVPLETAHRVSLVEDSTLFIGDQIYESTPAFVSNEATNGQLYSIIYTVPPEYALALTDQSFIEIETPIGIPDTGSVIPFIPIDAIFQTQDETFVFIVENSKAVGRKVSLGSVTGSFVEIIEGLSTSDQVILNRNVIDGDKIEVLKS